MSDLSEKSGVSISTIKRAETDIHAAQINAPNMGAIRNALENAGIEFVGTPEDRPGIRIAAPRPEK